MTHSRYAQGFFFVKLSNCLLTCTFMLCLQIATDFSAQKEMKMQDTPTCQSSGHANLAVYIVRHSPRMVNLTDCDCDATSPIETTTTTLLLGECCHQRWCSI